jgi:hypothetical protein
MNASNKMHVNNNSLSLTHPWMRHQSITSSNDPGQPMSFVKHISNQST